MHRRRLQAEVVVAGAGPVGCHAAMLLADMGRSVLLLDRARFPRWKPCAGAISAKAIELLPPELGSLLERPVTEAWLSLGPGNLTKIRSARPVGWLVHREHFDHAHLELVRGLDGVEVQEETTVRLIHEHGDRVLIETDRGTVIARALVGADGVESRVSRHLRSQRERDFAVSWEEEVELPGGDPVPIPPMQFDFAAFPGGYGWVFSKVDTCSIGGGYFGVATTRDYGDIKERCAAFRRQWPSLQRLRTIRRRGYRIPVGGTLQRLNSRRVVLAGDAADTVDPVTGEGIAPGLISARLAATAVDRLLGDGESLDRYSQQLWQRVHLDFYFARRLARGLYRHPHGAFAALFRNRVLCRWFLEVIRGDLSYHRLVLRALLRWPQVLAAYERGPYVEVETD